MLMKKPTTCGRFFILSTSAINHFFARSLSKLQKLVASYKVTILYAQFEVVIRPLVGEIEEKTSPLPTTIM
ncbi:hypothetical protein N480_18125 [Pseudoalteromonas luteoviolacea S2607]|nr:hypothetical protein N480_18125 [Pseudoalteromonas luteoviolacea S2607]